MKASLMTVVTVRSYEGRQERNIHDQQVVSIPLTFINILLGCVIACVSTVSWPCAFRVA